jgi:hypothetical protein
MPKTAGAAGEHYDARTNSWVPDTFQARTTARAMRGVGAYDEGTIKDTLGKRLLDRLIK